MCELGLTDSMQCSVRYTSLEDKDSPLSERAPLTRFQTPLSNSAIFLQQDESANSTLKIAAQILPYSHSACDNVRTSSLGLQSPFFIHSREETSKGKDPAIPTQQYKQSVYASHIKIAQ